LESAFWLLRWRPRWQTDKVDLTDQLVRKASRVAFKPKQPVYEKGVSTSPFKMGGPQVNESQLLLGGEN